MKKGFTLAEVLITLTVIGIITAVIIPVAFHSKPDENVLKFKKAHNTLYQVISELINSDKYYLNGKFSKKPDGTIIRGGFYNNLVNDCKNIPLGTADDVKYFCKTFSDVITTKRVNCSTAQTGVNSLYTFVAVMENPKESWQKTQQEAQKLFDQACLDKAKDVGEEIVTPDNVVFYQVNPAGTFGVCWGTMYTGDTEKFLFDNKTELFFQGKTESADYYKHFCIDIDGIGKGEAPFGYGIRADGKILPGKRATEWLEKSVQGEN